MARRRRYVPQRSSYQRTAIGKCPKCDFYGNIRTKKVQDDIEFICSNCGYSWKP